MPRRSLRCVVALLLCGIAYAQYDESEQRESGRLRRRSDGLNGVAPTPQPATIPRLDPAIIEQFQGAVLQICSVPGGRTAGNREAWDELNSAEVEYLRNVVPNKLNFRSGDSILSIDLEDPPKAAMLRHLDNGGPVPDRRARVVVRFLSSFAEKGCSEPCLMIYRVGTLPFPSFFEPSDVAVQALSAPNDIPYDVSGLTSTQWSRMSNALNDFQRITVVRNFFLEAFGNNAFSTTEWHTHDNERERQIPRSMRVSWKRRGSLLDYGLSHPVPLSCKVDVQGGARVHSIIYRDQFFAEVSDFTAALSSGTVDIVATEPFSSNPEWQTLNRREPSRPENRDPPPTSVDPSGRFTIRGGRVTWMGWSFHMKDRPRTGLALHDVVFRGIRIAYEISNQELQAIYTGSLPHMGNKALFDSVFRYGASTRRLHRGVDCPFDAQYFDSFCVFEHDTGLPLWRKDGYSRYSGAKNTELVVRSMFPVGNYDYMAEVKFRLDGEMDVGFGASGHMYLSAYSNEKDEPYGTRIHDDALANLHAHYAGFKVDLDILGTQNCLSKSVVKYDTRPNAANEVGWDVPPKNMFLEHSIVPNENGGRVIMNNRVPTTWRVVSCDETNAWGSAGAETNYLRGYEIKHPNTPLSIYDDGGFTNYHVVYAQRKESEPALTSQFDYLTRAKPYVSIVDEGDGGISDGESLVGEDIVAWVSLGFYHHPRAEDSPVTPTIASHFTLRPFNFFDENAGLDLYQSEHSQTGETVPRGECLVEV